MCSPDVMMGMLSLTLGGTLCFHKGHLGRDFQHPNSVWLFSPSCEHARRSRLDRWAGWPSGGGSGRSRIELARVLATPSRLVG